MKFEVSAGVSCDMELMAGPLMHSLPLSRWQEVVLVLLGLEMKVYANKMKSAMMPFRVKNLRVRKLIQDLRGIQFKDRRDFCGNCGMMDRSVELDRDHFRCSFSAKQFNADRNVLRGFDLGDIFHRFFSLHFNLRPS